MLACNAKRTWTLLLRYTGFGGTRAGISTQFGSLSGTCQVRAWPDETGFCTKRETLGSEGCECESSVCVRACERECIRYLRYQNKRHVTFICLDLGGADSDGFCPIGANATQRQLGRGRVTVHSTCMCSITHAFLPEVPGYVFYPCWVDDRQYFVIVSGQEERESLVWIGHV